MIETIYTGLFEFIEKYCTPSVNGNVFRGNQNRFPLPPSNNFAVIWITGDMCRGTNVENYRDFDVDVASARKIFFQVDFYGLSGLEQANSFEVAYWSVEGIGFLRDRSLAVHYADSIVQNAVVDASQQYVITARVTGQLGYVSLLNLEAQTANELKIHKSEVIQ